MIVWLTIVDQSEQSLLRMHPYLEARAAQCSVVRVQRSHHSVLELGFSATGSCCDWSITTVMYSVNQSDPVVLHTSALYTFSHAVSINQSRPRLQSPAMSRGRCGTSMRPSLKWRKLRKNMVSS